MNLDAARTRSYPRGDYEEYHPYGSTAWWAGTSGLVSQKRYRFTGMERDDETGLQCHGVRYYAAWLGRWVSADPIGLGGGLNSFRYCSDHPLSANDRSGMIPVADDPVGFNPPPEATTEWDANSCTPRGNILDDRGRVVRNEATPPDAVFSAEQRAAADEVYDDAKAGTSCIDMVRLTVGALLGIDVPLEGGAGSRTVLGSPSYNRRVISADGRSVDPQDTIAGLARRLDRAGLIGESAKFTPVSSRTGAEVTTSDALKESTLRRMRVDRFDASPGAAMLKMSGGGRGQFAYLVSFVSGTHSGVVLVDADTPGSPRFTFRDQNHENTFATAADLDAFLVEKSVRISVYAYGNYPSTLSIKQLLPRPEVP